MAFIDYRQTYDRVDRHKLLQYLENIGCGRNFLLARQHSMNANGVIGTEKFATTGVKQGGSSSVKLFTAYIDPTIDAVNALGPDDWFESKHILLLMDDKVIMATSREKLQAKKLEALKAKADAIGMILYPTKSQCMTVHSVNKEPFLLDDVVIN